MDSYDDLAIEGFRDLKRPQRLDVGTWLLSRGRSLGWMADKTGIDKSYFSRLLAGISRQPALGKDGNVYLDALSLNDRRQAVKVLYVEHDKTTSEIAGLTGWSKTTICSDLRALGIPTRPRAHTDATLTTSERLSALAALGYTSHRAAREVGIGFSRVRELARRDGIEFPADATTGLYATVNAKRVYTEVATALDGIVMSLNMVSPRSLDREEMDGVIQSVRASVRAISTFTNSLGRTR